MFSKGQGEAGVVDIKEKNRAPMEKRNRRFATEREVFVEKSNYRKIYDFGASLAIQND